MGEHEVTMAQAEIRALLRALLARSKTSLAERFNDPMQDGGKA